MVYLTAVFRGRSRQPRPLLVNFEGSAMSWPGPGFPRPGAVSLGRRGDICISGSWDYEAAPTSTLLEAIQIGAIQAFFFSSSNKAMASLSGVPYESYASHIGFFGHVALKWVIKTHHSLFPSLSDASFSASTPYAPSPPQWRPSCFQVALLLSGHDTPESVSAFNCNSSRVISPFWKACVQLRLVSRKPHGVALAPLHLYLHSRSLPRGCALITCDTALSTTPKPDRGWTEEVTQEIWPFVVHIVSEKPAQ
jgi:hypothetical protein